MIPREDAIAAARTRLKGASRYCFAHVPRTGGSALLRFLYDNLGNDCVLDTFVESKRFSIFRELRDSGAYKTRFAPHRFVHLHVPVQIQRYLEPEKLAYFTVLRHPFDRIISYYDWCRKLFRERNDERFGCPPDVSLETFIESKIDDVSLFNIYTYFLACLVDERVVRHDVWRSWVAAPPKDASALALEALERFYLVAPLEELESAAAILSAVHEEDFVAQRQATGATGLVPLANVSRSGGTTVTRHDRELSRHAMNLLAQASAFDLPLYEACMNRFYLEWSSFLNPAPNGPLR